MKKVVSSYVLLILLVSGCFFNRGEIPPPQPVLTSPERPDPARLKQGGKILVVPFTAGPDVTADEELDRISLMIVKGLSEFLSTDGTAFEVVSAEQRDSADFIMRGHITEKIQPGKFKKWVLMNKNISITVKGYVQERATQKEVLPFSLEREGHSKIDNYADLGYEIGRQIGRAIVEATGQ